MTFDQIITLALSISHTKADQISAANLKTYFNIARKELANCIVKDVNENYFYEIWIRDAIANQDNGEYPYPIANEDTNGMQKCLGLEVKPTSSEIFYTVAEEVDIKSLPHDWNWYLTNQPKSRPIFYIADKSIFVAPQFNASDLPAEPSGNGQLKLIGITKLADLDTGATDEDINIPEESHQRIAVGMKQWILASRGKTQEAIAAKNEFEYEKSAMVDELTNRNESVMIARTPNDNLLGYGN